MVRKSCQRWLLGKEKWKYLKNLHHYSLCVTSGKGLDCQVEKRYNRDMANITKIGNKPAKIKPRVVLFLKNVANGMTQQDAYMAAGFKATTLESAKAAASKL